VVVDYAHKRGRHGWADRDPRGLRSRGGQIWLAFCAAGDRQDDILHALGYRRRAEPTTFVVAELPRYLRGRDPEDVVARLRAGAEDAGATDVPALPDEVEALTFMIGRSEPHDVIGLTALGQRSEVFALLERRGAVRADPTTVRRLVERGASLRLASGRGRGRRARTTGFELLPHLGSVIHTEQHQIAGAAPVQGSARGRHLIRHDLRASRAGAARLSRAHTFEDDRGHLAPFATACVHVLLMITSSK
jgi:hypothetical protein